MRIFPCPRVRPPIHLLASESDRVAALALSAERQQPVVAAMLLEEIKRAELHGPDEMLDDYARLNSWVTFTDEKTRRTEAMKEVTRAYESGDLARLLEIERRWSASAAVDSSDAEAAAEHVATEGK